MHGEYALAHSLTSGAVTAALLIFLASYSLIITEKIHSSTVAIFGSALMIIAGIFWNFYDQDMAIQAIDFNTIGLLIGMMIIVGIVKDTGLFQYVAIKAAKAVKGDPWKIMVLFSVITAVFSALLDNVTTVLLMVPMTMIICDHLRINPMPFLLVEIFMSNIGGTATLIGDPPNILIGSAANLSFMDFILNITPIVVVIFFILIPIIKWRYKKGIAADPEFQKSIMKLNEKETIQDPKLLKKTLFVFALTTLGFFFHGFLGVEAATVAIWGAGLLLFLDNKNPEKAFQEIEWGTIFFFVGLFILVGGLKSVGVISWAAQELIKLTQGSLPITVMTMLWGGAIFSTFINNIPFVATVIPMIQEMQGIFANLDPIWWALALGVCLGGNGALVGASANLVVAGMAEKSGYKISFWEFMRMGLFIMLVTVAVSSVYVWVRYL